MIKLCFFARFREKLGTTEESMALDGAMSVTALMSLLAARGGAWQEVFDSPRGIMVAINQEMATPDSTIHDGDEVALFPPVTGG